jgi:DNA-binding protein Fis
LQGIFRAKALWKTTSQTPAVPINSEPRYPCGSWKILFGRHSSGDELIRLLGLNDLPAEAWRQLSESSDALPTPQRESEATGELDPHVIARYVRILLDANGWNLSLSLAHCEGEAVEAAMQRAHGNQSESARLLGITPRSVYNKMRKYRTGSKKSRVTGEL